MAMDIASLIRSVTIDVVPEFSFDVTQYRVKVLSLVSERATSRRASPSERSERGEKPRLGSQGGPIKSMTGPTVGPVPL